MCCFRYQYDVMDPNSLSLGYWASLLSRALSKVQNRNLQWGPYFEWICKPSKDHEELWQVCWASTSYPGTIGNCFTLGDKMYWIPEIHECHSDKLRSYQLQSNTDWIVDRSPLGMYYFDPLIVVLTTFVASCGDWCQWFTFYIHCWCIQLRIYSMFLPLQSWAW